MAMVWFLACLGFIWDPISRALDSFLESSAGEAVTRVGALTAVGVASTILLPSRAEDLRRETKHLKDARADRQAEIDSGTLRNMMPTQQAETWLKQVDEVAAEVDGFLESFQQRDGFFSMRSYELGRRADELLKEVRLLNTRGTDLAALCPARPDPVLLQPTITHSIVGEEETLPKIRGYLEADDARIIGIYGMGGIGKTTLLKAINNELSQTGSRRFDLVIYVTVSKDAQVSRVQEEIGKRLGLSKDALPPDLAERATTLLNALSRNKFLLLLDDLWGKLDLAQVGVSPLSQGSKIMFTTRSQRVCSNMHAMQTVKVPPLSKSKSWELFRRNMRSEEQWDPSVRRLAEAVAAKCGGLPLALLTVSCTMAYACTAGEWQAALRALKGTAVELEGMEEDVLTILKFSFDRLQNDSHRECLLYCSLFPEDYEIHVKDLIDYWMGEGFFDNGLDSSPIETWRDRGDVIVGDLKAACLLEDGYDKNIVKLHDTVREMALWITSGKCEQVSGQKKRVFLVNSGEQLTQVPAPERWAEATRISLMVNEISQLPEKPECRNLRTLLAYENHPLKKISGGLFKFMSSLTVLDLSRTGISHLPSEIKSLGELRYLNVSWTKINSLPAEVGLLVELRYLNLSHTNLESLATEVGRLTKLQQLNLEWTSKLKRIPCEAVANLPRLQLLDTYGSGYEWSWGWKDDGRNGESDSVGRQVCLRDLDAMEGLKELGLNLYVETHDDMQALHNSPRLCASIRFLHLTLGLTSSSSVLLSDFLSSLIGVRQLWVSSEKPDLDELIFSRGQNSHLEKLIFGGLSHLETISWKNGDQLVRGPSEGGIFINLLHLRINKCDALKEVTWSIELPQLQELWVWDCRKMEELVSSGMDYERDSCFPKLRVIELIGLPNLRFICRQPLLFPSLEFLEVQQCPELRKLPFGMHSTKNIKRIHGEQEWWNALDFEDQGIRPNFPFYARKRS